MICWSTQIATRIDSQKLHILYILKTYHSISSTALRDVSSPFTS